jgi:hypothetical protein
MEEQRKKIEDTINSLDGMQRAEAPAFFHTRAQARLEKRIAAASTMAANPSFAIKRPALVIGVLVILLVANLFLVIGPSASSTSANTGSQESATLQGFAGSYGLTTLTGY